MLKLLVVDDEKGFCNYLKSYFEHKGYNVLIANNAEDAISIVKKELPELVFLDIKMPDMSGLEALRIIKKTAPKTKVIMVSASGEQDTREKAKVLGADDFVKKPFTTDALEDVVILKVSEIIKSKESAKIIIVDDEEGIRSSLKDFLSRRFECEISEAGDGQAALDLIRTVKFDLIFLDIKMPGISGMDVIKEKKKLGIEAHIWVITRFDSEEMAHKVIEQGADDYIPKPFHLKSLENKISNFLVSIGKYKPKAPRGGGGSEK